jgi:NADPH:quinone reductase-like Zn-dependent oxidoreductase
MEATMRQEGTTVSDEARAVRAVPRAAVTMRAMVHDAYGPPDLLALREIAMPVVGDDGIRVRVGAAALHVGDCFTVRGAPLPVRMMTGMRKPRYGVPGFDLAGRVEAVGGKVTKFRPGDEVFGVGDGTCAEFAATDENRLALKPAHLSLPEAAALPTSGLAALHGLRDAGRIRPGAKVLINGASGGVGTFAVQLAKSFGAEVTGVCGPANLDLVRSLGADHVIDYTREDFTRLGPLYDLILDNVENRSLSACRGALAPGGTLVLNSGTGARGLAMLVRLLEPLVVSPFVRGRLRRFLSKPSHADLVVLKELAEAGKLRPVIDRTYRLEEVAAALGHIEGGHARGKVVVTI